MGDVMHQHQSLQQPDVKEFVKAVITKINGHVKNKNWELIPCSQVPPDRDIVPSVLAMRHKQNLATNSITKYNACLNLHRGRQVYGVNYFDSYVPVITWFVVQKLLFVGMLDGWSMQQVDFIMAYPKSDRDGYVHGASAEKGTP